MTYEKILKREDGTQVKIDVRLFVDTFRNTFRYSVSLFFKAKSKKLWRPVVDFNDYGFRRTDNQEQYKKEKHLKFVSEAELMDAKLELWHKIKPTNEQHDKD